MPTARPWVLGALAVLLAGCAGTHGSSPADPAVPSNAGPTALSLPVIESGNGFGTAAWGVFDVNVDPTTLKAEITQRRDLAAQGDLALLSVRPFFAPTDLEPVKVARGVGGTILLTVRVKHPFDAPADLNPPGSPVKRIDLHGFDLTLCAVSAGTDQFSFGSDTVTLDADLVANADGYRRPGPLFDAAALGAGTADTFPYRLVAANIDTGNPLGNYDPLANGWQGPALLAPTGYDVFPQGASVDVDFELNLGAGAASFALVPLVKYLQPKATDPTKSNRLPVAGDPTKLQYLLPEAAGDVQRITATVTGDLVGDSSSETAILDVTVLDWDHGAPVASPFPNNADTGQISEPSEMQPIDVVWPPIVSGMITGSGPTGTAPLIADQAIITNALLFDPPTSTTVVGLVRVTDEQDLDDTTDTSKPQPLGEGNPPVPLIGQTLESTRYQVVRVTVNPSSAGPSCPIYSAGAWALRAVVGLPYRLDLDSATTLATDPDGISLYRVDYNSDSTWDGSSAAPNGSDLVDFTGDPAFTYTTPGLQTLTLEISDGNAIPDTTICTLTVDVRPQLAITPDPLPVPGGINWNMPNNSISVTVTDHPDLLVADPSGDVYFLLRRSVGAPTAWFVAKSSDSGATWTTPSNQLDIWPTPANLDTWGSRGLGMGLMANGLPAVVCTDAGNDILFRTAISETLTTIDFGPTTNGTEIETAGDWYCPSVLPHPTNVNRLYVITKNNSATLGTNPFQSTLWITNNATAANPTFTIASTVDTDGVTTNEYDPIGAIDSLGDVHVTWLSRAITLPPNAVMYRKWLDGPQSWESAPVDVSTSAGTSNRFDDTHIKVNVANEPAITVANDPLATGTNGELYLAKFNTGSGWTTMRQASINTGPNLTTSFPKYSGIAFDALGRIHLVWRDTRQVSAQFEPWVTTFSSDGYTKLNSDSQILDATSATDFFTNTRIEFMPVTGKMMVVAFANGTMTDGKARYRHYSF